jgi:hypothetical protein
MFVELPEQIELLPLIETDGVEFMVIALLPLLLQPFASVTVTLYVPPVVTERQELVAPVFHTYETAFAGAHKLNEPPEQNELLPLIVQTAGLFIVTVFDEELLHPLISVIVTE